MVDKLSVGDKLHAMYLDGEYYPATVAAISGSQKRAKAPVKVDFVGYDASDSTWLPLTKLKSKKLPKAETKGKAKAKAKAKAGPPEMDYSGLKKGARLQAESGGKYYAAEVVKVSNQKGKQAPVRVHWVGYTNDSDEWLGADRLRSKAIKPKAKAKAKVKAKDGPKRFGMPPPAKKLLLCKPKIAAPLDPKFAPAVLGKRNYLEAAKDCVDKLEWLFPEQMGVLATRCLCFQMGTRIPVRPVILQVSSFRKCCGSAVQRHSVCVVLPSSVRQSRKCIRLEVLTSLSHFHAECVWNAWNSIRSCNC